MNDDLGADAASVSSLRALELIDVHKAFGEFEVIKGCTLAVQRGSILALVGANGAGKTTLFDLISGVLKCDAGRVLLDGADITRASSRETSRLGIGRTFQGMRIFDSLSVSDNVRVSIESHLFRGMDRSKIQGEVANVLEMVGLAGLEAVSASDLSYAEQKFLSIARVVSRHPKVLMLDEPASGLDSQSRSRLIKIIENARSAGATVVVVEHNLDFVADVATEIAFLDFGLVRAQGTPEDVMQRPELIEAYFGA